MSESHTDGQDPFESDVDDRLLVLKLAFVDSKGHIKLS